jgi:hypothetical protein
LEPTPPSTRRQFATLPQTRAIAIALAAAIAAGAFVWALNPGPRWQVAPRQVAHGNVLIADEPVPADDVGSLNDALLPGATLEWNGDGELELISRSQLALVITPGTRMTLPPPPARWFDRKSSGRIDEGEIRLTTGPRFAGATLTLETPDATLLVTGATLAVIRDARGTSVCVLEGAVRVRAGSHDAGRIPAGREVVLAGGKSTPPAEIRPIEKARLLGMRDAMRPFLED